MPPRTQYARSGDVHIAYQVFGHGPKNLVLVPGFVSQIETYWEEPNWARWLDRLGQFARVALFDKRGTGLSDRGVAVPDMDKRMDDIRAVMDAAGMETAFVMGISEGGSLASVFAAYQAPRCDGLILYGAFASFESWFPTQEALEELFDYAETSWGTGAALPMFCPDSGHNQAFQDWWGKYERTGASPRDLIEIMKVNSKIDIKDILPAIRIPTLVMHKTEDALIDIEGGRTLARLIPGATLIELEGRDHFVFLGKEGEQILAEVNAFVTGSRPAPVFNRVLAAVVFTDIVESTLRAETLGDAEWRAILDAHDRAVRDQLSLFHGHEVKTLGDGFLATFDGPGRAIHCAKAIEEAVGKLGIPVRIGVHTGEVEVTDDDVRGIAVNIAARIAQLGNGGDILVSRTVKDLVAGSGLDFEDLGSHRLRGLSDEWSVYRAL
ncbi:adenylate/guanylate cyclase domain-containing protein [Ruegeria marina]|uniref:Adenylate cyclase, class 3 n=1 Tax=Ruegeria marina TaxID=639004 RepID=A0A1G6R1Q5_9RHOB|nr:adenylate/guanylate cyclase domain-containing protein [Ruegeria marina]SDC98552.1 Adenylate cyclase, class 3 [Ruegeria marina]